MNLIFFKMAPVHKFLIHIFCVLTLCGITCGLECYTNANIDDSGPVVETKLGTVVGKYVKVLDKEVPVFLGIPFAEPPVGEMRFQISKPVSSYDGTLLAKEKSPACMQYSSRDVGWVPRGLNFSEDCLYLNVWLPPNCCCNRSDKLPVMLWLFSGGYYSGSGMMDVYDGDVLATYGDVIVVTINYRVGVFGFLYADTKEAPGNQGLYDQLLALQWVRENIENFGGDPNSITLFGESAGAFAVSLQMVSPHAQNLFHKVILESGTSALPITVETPNTSFSKGIQLSKLVGCSIDISNSKSLSKDILHCFMKKSGKELAIAENYYTSKFPGFFFPTFGNKCEDCFKYFSELPTKTLQSGNFPQKPTLMGINKDEGTLFLVYTTPTLFRRDIKTLLTTTEAWQVGVDFFSSEQITPPKNVIKYYIENITGDSSDVPLTTLSRIYGDFLFKCASMIVADNTKDVYYYLYSHRSSKDTDAKWIGVTQFAEVPYVFGDPIRNPQNYTSEDQKVSKDIIQKFTSFVHLGYPVTKDSEPEWPKYSSSDRKVFEIKYGKKRITQFPSEKACVEIWKPFFEK